MAPRHRNSIRGYFPRHTALVLAFFIYFGIPQALGFTMSPIVALS